MCHGGQLCIAPANSFGRRCWHGAFGSEPRMPWPCPSPAMMSAADSDPLGESDCSSLPESIGTDMDALMLDFEEDVGIDVEPKLPRSLDGCLRDDVMELFSPPRVVPICMELGLRGGLSIDLETGFDLLQKSCREKVLLEVARRRPRVIISSAPCTWFSALMRMWNVKKMSEPVQLQREHEAVQLFEFGMEVGKQQLLSNNGFIHEHPETASSWKRPSVQELIHLGACKSSFDMCRFGMVSPKTNMPLKKGTTLLSNVSQVQVAFHRKRCVCHPIFDIGGKMVKHRTIQGSDHGVRLSRHAQKYPPILCRTLARCVLEHCRGLQVN